MTVQTGDPFPRYTATSHEGETVTLPDYGRDANLVVFFYPRATTRGCVRETTEFGARSAELSALGAKVVGVSVDDPALQNEHAVQCAANFPLLCDTDKSLTTQLGILNDRGMASRTTYILDRQGVVRRVFEVVSVDGHVDEVLAALKGL
ncbi:MAG TPA: peroxiredoxin [Dehalococcoidia bacterium]|jgi:peroxiredoxin Q/BCP|nr:peroxiredoxin [Dehalococcoidia bacterium]